MVGCVVWHCSTLMCRLKHKCWVFCSRCAPVLGLSSLLGVCAWLAAPGPRFLGVPCQLGLWMACLQVGVGWVAALVLL